VKRRKGATSLRDQKERYLSEGTSARAPSLFARHAWSVLPESFVLAWCGGVKCGEGFTENLCFTWSLTLNLGIKCLKLMYLTHKVVI
jgi:hypothetical protein